MQKRERIEPGQLLASFDHRYPLNWRAMVLKILSELFVTITDTNRFDIRDKRFNTETLCFVELSLFCILDYSPILHCVKGTNCLDGLEFMASSVECLVALKAVVLVYWNGKISLRGVSFANESFYFPTWPPWHEKTQSKHTRSDVHCCFCFLGTLSILGVLIAWSFEAWARFSWWREGSPSPLSSPLRLPQVCYRSLRLVFDSSYGQQSINSFQTCLFHS